MPEAGRGESQRMPERNGYDDLLFDETSCLEHEVSYFAGLKSSICGIRCDGRDE